MPDVKEGQTLPMPGYNWKHMPLVSALVYSFISIAITLFNKAVLTSYSESKPEELLTAPTRSTRSYYCTSRVQLKRQIKTERERERERESRG